jgi:hypothetical protein
MHLLLQYGDEIAELKKRVEQLEQPRPRREDGPPG